MVTYSCIMYIGSSITRLHNIIGGFMIKSIYWKVKVPQNPEHHQYVSIVSWPTDIGTDSSYHKPSMTGVKKLRRKIMASKIHTLQQHKLYILHYSNINSLILCLDVK